MKFVFLSGPETFRCACYAVVLVYSFDHMLVTTTTKYDRGSGWLAGNSPFDVKQIISRLALIDDPRRRLDRDRAMCRNFEVDLLGKPSDTQWQALTCCFHFKPPHT